MPKITILPNGINGGFAGGGNQTPPKRGVCNGWSVGSARRNQRFLKSVNAEELSKGALAYTLTVNELPEDHAEWARLINKLRMYIRYHGGIIDHWVTERTRKGRPHLHGVVFYDDPERVFDLLAIEFHWLKLTRHLGTSCAGQFVRVMNNSVGWFQYMSKHASRGFHHYQREADNLPEGWQKTGRMWGKGGDWPIYEDGFNIDQGGFFKIRRMVKRYLIAEAQGELAMAIKFRSDWRIEAALRRIGYLKRSLKGNDRKKSEVRGINEWIDNETSFRMLATLPEESLTPDHEIDRACND